MHKLSILLIAVFGCPVAIASGSPAALVSYVALAAGWFAITAFALRASDSNVVRATALLTLLVGLSATVGLSLLPYSGNELLVEGGSWAFLVLGGGINWIFISKTTLNGENAHQPKDIE